jgi:hypothetical protein
MQTEKGKEEMVKAEPKKKMVEAEVVDEGEEDEQQMTAAACVAA